MYINPQERDPVLFKQLCEANPQIAASIATIEAVYSNTGVLSERRKLEQLHEVEMNRLYARANVRSMQGPMLGSPIPRKVNNE
jgi:hypothetical protein